MSPRFLSLRTSSLNGCGLASERRGEVAGAHTRALGDQRQHVGSPRPGRAGAVEPVEATVDVGDVVGRQLRGRRELVARIGPGDGMEPHPIQREVVGAAQVGDELRRRRVAGPPGVRIRDRRRLDHVDLLDLDHAGGGSVAMAGDGLAPLPAPERERDGTVGDGLPEPSLEQHGRHLGVRDTSRAQRRHAANAAPSEVTRERSRRCRERCQSVTMKAVCTTILPSRMWKESPPRIAPE